ncbi:MULTISPECIES: maltose ABC transporter permease MalF [Vibrio]|jgi:maltose/maltodextrin transport system permease protein|uniref:Maltose/maltodextrin transport system permease protein n=1 Tax=Vibrio rotiferianus TaxID=190895 RepID=A0A2K7SP67_9VIBR|nr:MULTISPECIES: maltose ABC transporter permease MalF [Vibrio]ASI94708.1 maltose ABC transporter permease MalF [Vibrio rotiferianus]MDK9777555.1 maltose ABC transporter permease MalF [Vibrio sp. D401a]MDK9802489.1 maltose ABC transporter permease MalF [Vibrio sp. D406a]NOH48333.1 maltose ABC transporter permease MalF [Vibrio rotiferianus]NOH69098.1 maltose ABC transporter permease MalF [Vibrio rotiferianus]
MQSVQGTDAMTAPDANLPSSKKVFIKWALLGSIGFINGYATILMYSRGEIAFALLTLILTALALYIFGSKKTYAHRYIYPGIAGMILFILFPLAYTVGLSFTNYSAKNQLSLERAQSVLLDRTYQSGDSYPFTLYKTEQGHQIVVEKGGELLATPSFQLEGMSVSDLDLTPVTEISGEKEPIKTIVKNRSALSSVDLHLPSGDDIRMSGLRKFAAVVPLFTLQEDGQSLYNNKSGETLLPNMEVGYYQPVDESGQFVGNTVSPGFIVTIGSHNFERVWKDDGIKEPFISIFIWTVLFSALSVLFTLIIGLVLASVVQWEELKGRSIYRLLLILPYAVPAFISILIFKGLFNQSFGEINMLLEGLFGISPAWFSDPFMAKTMILIVNTWLGFPYMMILCMGLLKAIPEDLYEASAIDGANFVSNFTRITLPMMIKPLTPLLIASFAFNFNNFVLIALLTGGGPNMIGTSEPAGYTDLLVSYTYRIAFEGAGGQDFGLASAVATLIFLLVGALALINLRVTKVAQD